MYYLVAIILSGAWLSIYLISPLDEMIEEAFKFPKVIQWALFPFISLAIATVFKKWILSCRGWKGIMPSAILPWCGTLAVSLVTGLAPTIFSGDSSPNVTSSLFGAFWYGTFYTIIGYWAIFPLGVLSQYTLLSVSTSKV